MDIFWLVVLFIFGSIVGSFLNVCIYRLPRDKSPWHPSRSYCPHCHEVIVWYDNIPLISYFALSAQCRQCGSHISPRYVVVEFLTATVFALTYGVLSARGESLPVIIVYLAIVSFLIMSSFIDLELRIIPNALTIGGILLAPVVSVLVPALHANPAYGRTYVFSHDNLGGPLAASLVGMAVGAAATWLAGVGGKILFKREAMGFGDVKFMAALGGFLGWQPVLLVFFTAPLVGAAVGVIHLLRTGEHHIPYGPFLSFAAFVAMLWGGPIFSAVGVARFMVP
jgi:leader peptidase (prepilin peptidase)/N-methyltransferase